MQSSPSSNRDREQHQSDAIFASVTEGKPVDKEIALTFNLDGSASDNQADSPQGSAPPVPRKINAGVVNGKALALPKPCLPFRSSVEGCGGNSHG